jgi:hypothetical protein
MSESQDSLARAIGGVLWKWYEDLMSAMGSSKKKWEKLPPQQISQSLSRWEDTLAETKKKIDLWD